MLTSAPHLGQKVQSSSKCWPQEEIRSTVFPHRENNNTSSFCRYAYGWQSCKGRHFQKQGNIETNHWLENGTHGRRTFSSRQAQQSCGTLSSGERSARSARTLANEGEIESFERGLHMIQKGAGVGAVNETVVEGEAEVGHRTDGDGIVDHDRTLHHPAEA